MILIKGIIGTCFLLLAFYSLTSNDLEFVNAREEIEQSVEDIKFTAGVETLFDTKIEIEAESEDTKGTEVKVEEDVSFDLIGYTTANVNIRKKPSLYSNIIEIIPFNTKIQYANYNSDWIIINYNETNCYVSKKYISDKAITYTSYNVPKNTGFKSFMPYKAITNKSSKQYKLQQKAYTGNYGIRMVEDRYCAVLGSYFKKEIGTRFDLVLENGAIIKCILGDIKSSKDTKEDNITSFNGCISEFIVDTSHLSNNVKALGDMSHCNDSWNSPVVKINFY